MKESDRLFLGLKLSRFSHNRKSSSKILGITVFKNPLDDGSSPWKNVERFPQGEIVVDSLGGFDLSQATDIDPETFPKSNEFLQNLLDGKYEFPLDGESGTYVVLSIDNASERSALIEELAAAGIKHTPENIVEIDRTSGGKIVWLETGNDRAGLQHIIKEHGSQFADKGISQEQIPDVVISAVIGGKIVGTTGEDRPIYETIVNGETKYIAVTVSSNGYIVGANPVSKPR